MNILFFTTFKILPEGGGIERISSRLAAELSSRYGHTCFAFYNLNPYNAPDSEHIFKRNVKIKRNDTKALAKFIKDNDIDIILNQSNFYHASFLRKAISASGISCSLIFAHHYSPGTDMIGADIKDIIRHLELTREGIKNILSLLAYPFRVYRKFDIHNKYRKIYEDSDATVLLSPKFIKRFAHFGRFDDISKFHIIPNMLTFNQQKESDLKNLKKKKVLVVGRLEDNPKNITMILDIWKKIEDSPEFNDWTLEIVGDGRDAEKLKEYAHGPLNLTRAIFHGRRDPLQFYREAAMLLMASSYEGFPLTLTEAQQNGCVPIVFNSFDSANDIITDGVDGYVIKPFDTESYYTKITDLMKAEALRLQISNNAFERCQRFSADVIIAKWQSLFTQIRRL